MSCVVGVHLRVGLHLIYKARAQRVPYYARYGICEESIYYAAIKPRGSLQVAASGGNVAPGAPRDQNQYDLRVATWCAHTESISNCELTRRHASLSASAHARGGCRGPVAVALPGPRPWSRPAGAAAAAAYSLARLDLEVGRELAGALFLDLGGVCKYIYIFIFILRL